MSHAAPPPAAGAPPTPPDPCIRALEHAADLAVRAPSVHNTQPWRLGMHPDRMDLRVDRTRQLTALDPQGRAMFQSVGAALLTARVALAAEDWAVEVDRFPRHGDPDLVAVLRPVTGRIDRELAALAPAVAERRTNRRRFAPGPVPEDVLRHLTSAAAAEDTTLVPVVSEAQRQLVARLTRQADAVQNASPAYRAELRHWTTRAASSGEGVPGEVVPRSGGAPPDAVPIRDFDTGGTGALPPRAASGAPGQTLVLLATRDDDPKAWLRSGEALQRVLLELTRLGWVAGPITQAIEVPVTRTQLRAALRWDAHPQMLLRIGRAEPTGRTPRRPRSDAVTDSWQPPRPGPDQEPPASSAGPRHPVSDGRGGTTWV
ncbi:Acg family FMN-binding oxidoreductase [Blastococcus tunisiensis]|uniref:Nitroreductase family protein n=1 Tax=Blastococcus tunisiensis TaxID=1798228 RepID=A0A1I2E126_9ACTN|nr:nitroreductase family protein [Blastococcus sp. DSM 46838]SFE86366.1 Nitroreductase family protein [Blastococcus sp. DSM 46838]